MTAAAMVEVLRNFDDYRRCETCIHPRYQGDIFAAARDSKMARLVYAGGLSTSGSVKMHWGPLVRGSMVNSRPMRWLAVAPGTVLGVRLYCRRGWTMQFGFEPAKRTSLGDTIVVGPGCMEVSVS